MEFKGNGYTFGKGNSVVFVSLLKRGPLWKGVQEGKQEGTKVVSLVKYGGKSNKGIKSPYVIVD